jgi:hypothetical protein
MCSESAVVHGVQLTSETLCPVLRGPKKRGSGVAVVLVPVAEVMGDGEEPNIRRWLCRGFGAAGRSASVECGNR